MNKLVILSRSFAKGTDAPLKYLDAHGISYELIRNDRPLDTRRIASSIGDAKAVITGSDMIDSYVLDSCPNLELVSKHGVGLDNIDLELAKARGVRVRNTPETNNESVADMTLLLMLALLRDLPGNRIMSKSPEWSGQGLTRDMFQKSVGILGFGKIGSAVAKRLIGFDCTLLVCDPCVDRSIVQLPGVSFVEFDEMLREADIVTLHAPLTKETHGIIGARALSLMKPTSIIINTSRGALIDEKALYDALKSGRISGAGLDVFSTEPPVDEPLLTLDNVIATPHIAPHTVEANYRMGMAAAKNVVDYFKSVEMSIQNETRTS